MSQNHRAMGKVSDLRNTKSSYYSSTEILTIEEYFSDKISSYYYIKTEVCHIKN